MLTSDQIERFRRDGYLMVPNLISPELAAELARAGADALDRVARHHDVGGTWTSAGLVGSDASHRLLHCHDMQFHDARFTRLLTEPDLCVALAQLLGTDDVQLHHNKLFVKPPGVGSPFPMHQDWPFFPHERDSTLAVIIHLDDAPVEKGCVRVVPGSHRGGRLDHERAREWYLPPNRYSLDDAIALPAGAGDALFFGCLTVHGSGPNRSDEPRTTWLLQVRDAADRPTVMRHLSPGQGTMLRGAARTDPPAPSRLRSAPDPAPSETEPLDRVEKQRSRPGKPI